MRLAITRCYNCICNACSKFYCPHRKTRCYGCSTLELRKIYDCDYFESKYTAPKRYKLKRKYKAHSDLVQQKLDFIIEQLERGEFKPQYNDGTYEVFCDGMIFMQGTYQQAEDFINKYSSEFNRKLKLRQLKMNI